MARQFSRREFLMVSGAFGASSVLAACAQRPPATTVAPTQAPAEAPTEPPAEAPTEVPPAAGQPVVRYWHAWGWFEMFDAWKALDVFKEMTEGFTVEFTSSANFEKQMTAVAAGDPPDVLVFFDYVNWWRRGLCYALDDYIAVSTIIKPEYFFETAWQAANINGKQYGVPAVEGFIWYGAHINTRMAEQAGLDPTQLPVTFDEWFEWHKALTAFDEAGNLLRIGFDIYGEMAGVYEAMSSWFPAITLGVKHFDEESGTYYFDNPAFIEYTEMATKFYEVIGPDNMSAFRGSYDQWGPATAAEVQAMTIEGYWFPGRFAKENPDAAPFMATWWLPVPEERRGTKICYFGSSYSAIPVGAKYPDLGFRLMEFLATDEAGKAGFDSMGFLFPKKSLIASIDPQQYPGFEFYMKMPEEANEFPPIPRDPLCGFLSEQWSTLREQAYRRQITAEECMVELQRRATEEYQNQFGE